MTGMDFYIIPGLAITTTILAFILLRLYRHGDSGIANKLAALEKGQERTETILRGELSALRSESARSAREQRQELASSMKSTTELLQGSLEQITTLHRQKLEELSSTLGNLTRSNDLKMDGLRQALDQKLSDIRRHTEQSLDRIREKVDKELHDTLEKRLGESFKLVSERLEKVQYGIGEMQELAKGVGDLKKVLTNVKTRGTWGEIQLGNLLEQILAPSQYETNVAVNPGTGQRVEFAIKLPGKSSDNKPVYLPLDSKFPVADYQRLVDAGEEADPEKSKEAATGLIRAIKENAKSINGKYIHPPYTTDFGVMYLPVEGLFAEVVKFPGLLEEIQVNYRVTIAGPTTLAAFLNSLQMGFRTLAIQERAQEVWEVLKTVKASLSKLEEDMDRAVNYLEKAEKSMNSAINRRKRLGRNLEKVESLPDRDSTHLLKNVHTKEDDSQ
ncbi:MAG: DNA recombination protein RmuC [Deltaproteobacteria bacterium]|nr:DNA recombination protein RmuC [Deltaproteobacteria bacterium]